jgi:molybdopterin converting factor small subunit
MIKVKVEVYTVLKKYAEDKIGDNNIVLLKSRITLEGLARYLNIPEKLGLIFLVNNSPKDKKYRLFEGDEVKIFSIICGG